MAQAISTDIQIEAPPEQVWAILMDFASYPDWNPFIVSIEGKAKPGETLQVRIHPPGSSPQTFKPVVQRADAPEMFIWRGSLPIPGLFIGEHSFRLTRKGDNTKFSQAESFTGLLVPLLKKTLAGAEEGFNLMNAALKARAEAQ